jgi:hypothetical protein
LLKGGEPVDLQPAPAPTRWPWERAMVMTQADLKWETVYGGGGADAR